MKKKYTALLIDDERLARVQLRKLLTNFSDTFSIVGEAKNGREAAEMIRDLQPDILFLDIEMPGQTGFELLEKLDQIPMVVFCTAYEEYSLKAFETNSIDYLVKPIRLERLQQTVEKIEELKSKLSSENFLKTVREIAHQKEKKQMTTITVKKNDKITFIKLEDISHFKATDKYVALFTDVNEELIEHSLTKLEEKLPANFLRVHRSIIVNTDCIKGIQKYFNNSYVITLKNAQKTTITSGRSYKEVLKNWMDV